MGPVDGFDRIFGRFTTFLGYVVGGIIAAIPLLITVDVLLRNFTLVNLSWLQEIIEYGIYIGTFVAAPWALRQGAHVRVDILLTSLPPAPAHRLGLMVEITGFVVCAALFYYGCISVWENYVTDSRQFKEFVVYDWWLLTVFAFSTLLLSVEFLLRLRRAMRETETEETGRKGF